jgi:hypothetical protein
LVPASVEPLVGLREDRVGVVAGSKVNVMPEGLVKGAPEDGEIWRG